MKVVTSGQQALNNIESLQRELRRSSELMDRLGLVHAWYIDPRDEQAPTFGFSKYIGYQDLDAEIYLKNYKELDGRNTEWVLRPFFDELSDDSTDYRYYHAKLSDWLGSFGRTPRKSVRLMVLKSEHFEKDVEVDRRLLDLILAVATLLPIGQRQELRSRL